MTQTPSPSKPQVGDIWYRFEDSDHSVADEYGDHAYTTYDVRLCQFWVTKLTPCGVWLRPKWGDFPFNPEGYFHTKAHFQNLSWNKKVACPTLAEAYISYEARKNRAIRIYTARIREAEAHKKIALRKVTDELRKRGLDTGSVSSDQSGLTTALGLD